MKFMRHSHQALGLTIASMSIAMSRIAAACTMSTLLLVNSPSLQAGSSGDWDNMKGITPQGYVCAATKSPIVLDGKLDEASWKSAPWTNDFNDIEADLRPIPRQRTRAKMLWDADYVYIAAEISEQHIQGTITKHDEVIFQDNDFEVFIDPDGDNHAYYEFEMNALNTTWDLFLPKPYKDGGVADNSWEFQGLKSAVHLEGTINDPSDVDSFWSLEIAIPWKAFPKHPGYSLPPRNGDQWRFGFSRVEWQFDVVDGKYQKVPKTKEDNWVWSPQGIVDMHRPERWGFVEFTSDEANQRSFAHDESLTIRDNLMEVYHRQRAFREKNGLWAADWKALDFEPKSPSSESARMQANSEGYTASLVQKTEDGTKRTWFVRQDSKLWSQMDDKLVQEALGRSGENRKNLESALTQVAPEQLEAMEFLIANMPDRDLKSLTTDFLTENVQLSYQALNESPWKDQIPTDIFLNNILPYANINEGREPWRKDFRARFLPLIEGATSPSQAAAMLNQKLFPLVKVKYSTQRAKADQNPTESIKSGLASCTGLSILLIDACRAVGIPARFVGTPLWSDNSGNHSWVEVWDDGWHFTGAAEPSGEALDQAWFIGRAATAKRDSVMNAIYAVSFQKTPLKFPLVWDRSIDYIKAVNVTDRYTQLGVKTPEGKSLVMVRVLDANVGQRVAAKIRILDQAGKELSAGQSKDERFDTNDHLQFYLPMDQEFSIEASEGGRVIKQTFPSPTSGKTITLELPPKVAAISSATRFVSAKVTATDSLTKAEAEEALQKLWQEHVASIRESRADEMKSQEIVMNKLKMPFSTEVFGEKPETGRSMYISMHGGGGAPSHVNNQQWDNQKKLYKLEEGVYVVPRAPTDTWDLWHQSHIDQFFDRLIENCIVFEDVDPNRVYIMGYSAGGDGVYQLAPRMADRLAAASMMAGHPNETSPLGLRNLPFTLHMGGNDTAYNRNKIAAEWAMKLEDLQKQDPKGYVHFVKIHEGKGHWMDRKDAQAIPWMAQYTRDPFPSRIVWKQDDVVQKRFYWLAVEPTDIRERALVIANRDGQTFDVQSQDVDKITLRFNDSMIDFDQPIKITSGEKVLFEGKVERSLECIKKTLSERGDRNSIYSSEVTVALRP